MCLTWGLGTRPMQPCGASHAAVHLAPELPRELRNPDLVRAAQPLGYGHSVANMDERRCPEQHKGAEVTYARRRT